MSPFVLVMVGAFLLSAWTIHAVQERIPTGKIGINPAVGIRTRYTMANEDTWRAGHRDATPQLRAVGRTFLITAVLGAVLFVLSVVAVPGLSMDVLTVTFVVVTIAGSVLALVFSFLAAHKANEAAKTVLETA